MVVRDSTFTIKADRLSLDLGTRIGTAEGFFMIDDGRSALAGHGGTFDFLRHAGMVYDTRGAHGDWRLRAKSARKTPEQRFDYWGADFTGCNFEPPHYHFRSTRLTVVPQRYMLARNAVFYLGRVPIFYTPVLYKSLKPRHLLRMRLEPGYDRRNGPFMKGTLITEHAPSLYSKLYLDYYAKQGVGTGLELERNDASRGSRGALLGYRIKETSTGNDRWGVIGNGYETLGASWAAQGRLQWQSDADFNNHYARSRTLRVTPELLNSAALVYRRPLWNARLSYDRRDEATAARTEYFKTSETAPRLDAQTAPLRLWRLPWLNTFSGYAQNNYSNARPYLERSVNGDWFMTRSFSLVRWLTFTPGFGVGETFYDRLSPVDTPVSQPRQDIAVARYRTANTLRFSTLVGALDFGHSFTRRLQPDALNVDRGASDYGIETNAFTLVEAFRPTRRSLARFSSGYDLRRFRDRELAFRERVDPIVAELSYAARNDLNLTVRDDYQLARGNRSFIGTADWGDRERGRYAGGGFGYTIGLPDRYQWNTELGWSPSTHTWRLEGALRGEASHSGGIDTLHAFHAFEKELSITKTWHDFFTRVMVRFRPGFVQEVNVRLSMRLPSFHQEPPAGRRDWESEWFPERARAGEDRP